VGGLSTACEMIPAMTYWNSNRYSVVCIQRFGQEGCDWGGRQIDISQGPIILEAYTYIALAKVDMIGVADKSIYRRDQ
jgi:hypothetical protein